MKPTALTCICILLATAACNESQGPSGAARQSPSFAEAFTTTLVFPLDFITPNPCTGEALHVTGEQHFKSHETVQPDGTFNFEITTNTQGTQAEAIATGVRYVVKEVITEKLQDIPPGTTATLTHQLHMIRSGEALVDDDFMLHVLFHFTINANGVVTVVNFDFRAECV